MPPPNVAAIACNLLGLGPLHKSFGPEILKKYERGSRGVVALGSKKVRNKVEQMVKSESTQSDFPTLDGRNRAIVTAGLLARVIAAIPFASVRSSSSLPQNTGFGPHRPCVRCAAIRIARLAFIGVVFVRT